MATICLVTGQHLVRNPRVVKEANVLREAGHRVIVVRPLLDPGIQEKDRQLLHNGVQLIDSFSLVPAGGNRGAGLFLRARRRFGAEAVRHLRWELDGAMAYGLQETLRAASAQQADLTIGHQETGAYVAARLARKGARIGADFEDWYSRDLLPAARRYRPLRLLRCLEGALLHHAAHTTTTSHAMARALAAAYHAPPPRAIYNAFPGPVLPPAEPRAASAPLRLHWFSQRIGPGRGLEILLPLLRLLERPLEVHLRGTPEPDWLHGFQQKFAALPQHRLILHPPVPPAELPESLRHFDVGLALEHRRPTNHNLTISNKLFQYLQASLPVLATETEGQMEAAERAPGAVFLLRRGGPEAAAALLRKWQENAALLRDAAQCAAAAAAGPFSWERQAQVLCQSVEEALRQPCAVC